MNSSSFFILLSCLVSLAIAQCPDTNCREPIDPPSCGVPNCNDMDHLENRYHPNALFPDVDPNFYWQCAPYNVSHWAAFRRMCACGTVFNPFIQPRRRCTFWDDRTWQPICGWRRPPELRVCDPWCPDCGPDVIEPSTTTPAQIVTETTTTRVDETTTTSSQCGCPPTCPPCIWWPCWPCSPCWCRSTLANART